MLRFRVSSKSCLAAAQGPFGAPFLMPKFSYVIGMEMKDKPPEKNPDTWWWIAIGGALMFSPPAGMVVLIVYFLMCDERDG